VKKYKLLLATLGSLSVSAAAQTDLADKFGKRESIQNIALSPDGKKLIYIEPIGARGVGVYIVQVGEESSKQIFNINTIQSTVSWCDWASNSRLVCQISGIATVQKELAPFSQTIAFNADGTGFQQLGKKNNSRSLFATLGDGAVLGWNASDDGQILMSRYYVPELKTGTILGSSVSGFGVERLDTSTLKSVLVEPPKDSVSNYIADASGTVRMMAIDKYSDQGEFRGTTNYYYRTLGSRDWKFFSTKTLKDDGLFPLTVDSVQNVAYVIGDKDGRKAIFKVSLDGNMVKTLVSAHEKVDVEDLMTLGRSGRVIGVSILTDKREAVLVDPELKALATRLNKALPGLPIIGFVGASRDEKRLMIFAGSDSDPGRYYVYDKESKQLRPIAVARPELEGVPLSAVKPVSYPAADGTMIPGYLTLPPGSNGKGLPAIVLPHGGPEARDEWGFDWLSQYFAAQGYAVLQPNFRGSSGYGNDWYKDNGFKSWRIAIGDVNDAGKWLVSQGIADPKKLGIFGWSYGGYAALQSGVLAPDLFKAVVAVAPVTDLNRLVDNYGRGVVIKDFVGTGPHLQEGSPVQQAAKLTKPILMFSGDKDLNVNIGHARAMDAALRRLGKSSELIVYPGLEHQLDDSVVRADMLRRSLAFFEKNFAAK
jgi:dipeptidyl aminopeptidase/acylaminoacyl peptidase